MAYAVLLSEELVHRLALLSERLKRGVDKLVVEAVEQLLRQHRDKAELAEIVALQFTSPLRIP